MKSIFFATAMLFSTLCFAKQVPLDLKASSVEWMGQKKLTGDSHTGTVAIEKGTINVDEKNEITGGTIVLNMLTIKDKDLSGKYKEKLEAHLNSEDFFATAQYKEASFKITKVTPTRSDLYTVTGNLTLRGVTNPETFELKIGKKGKVLTASGVIEIDRNKYGVTYNSSSNLVKNAVKIAKDKVIKDEIQLTLNLQTEAL